MTRESGVVVNNRPGKARSASIHHSNYGFNNNNSKNAAEIAIAHNAHAPMALI